MQESRTEESMSKDKHVRDNEAANAESGTAGEAELDIGSGAAELDIPLASNQDDGKTASEGQVPSGEEGQEPAQDESPTGEQASAEESAEERVARLEAENAELSDSLLRKTADFDNYRKRMLREKDEFAAYANRELLLDIVGIIDDFERAIRSADESHDFTAFHDGIVMIEKQFISMLERKWKLVRFDSVGQEFDPQRHEAMMTEQSPDLDEPVVVEDFQKGYMLHDKVLRPAKVKVSMPGDASASDKA